MGTSSKKGFKANETALAFILGHTVLPQISQIAQYLVCIKRGPKIIYKEHEIDQIRMN